MSQQTPGRPPLDAEALAGRTAAVPDLHLEVVRETASSNALAAERARAGAPDGTVVVADHQTGGRGRLDRTWVTPPGTAATFSLVLRPDLPPRAWPWLPLLVGHAVGKELRALGVDAAVKWPNDVLVGDRKVAGILLERVETPEGPVAVVGVGINVGMTSEELPVETATSLAVALGEGAPTREEVLGRVVVALREAYDAWRAGGEQATARLVRSYSAACATLDREVRVDLPGGEVLEGRAVEVDGDGRLVVERADGGRTPVAAGDVVHVRAA